MLDCSWTDEWDKQRERERQSETERELVNDWLWVFHSRTVGVAGSLAVKSNTIFEMPLDFSHRPSLLALVLISPFLCTHFQFDACQIQIHFMSPSLCVCVYLWFNYCCKFVQQSHKSHSDTHITNFLMENIFYCRTLEWEGGWVGDRAAGAIKSLSKYFGSLGKWKQISCVFLFTCVLIEGDFNDKDNDKERGKIYIKI